MKKLTFILGLAVLMNFTIQAQDDVAVNIANEFDMLDADWHEIANKIDNYEGFNEYCSNKDYQLKVMETLHQIHHFDSLVLDRLNDPTYVMNEHERKATLKEISKFESKYSARSFVVTLKKECKARREIERDSKHNAVAFGGESYDGQKYVLEVELGNYVHHITKIVDHIDKHVHHLNLN